MRKLVWDTSFRNAFKRQIYKNSDLEDKIFEGLAKFVENPFSSSLKTHKLSGLLRGLWTCRVEYD
jgi:mRNA interferase YafQ